MDDTFYYLLWSKNIRCVIKSQPLIHRIENLNEFNSFDILFMQLLKAPTLMDCLKLRTSNRRIGYFSFVI